MLSIGRCSYDDIKLLNTDERRAAYASLSHCWGRGVNEYTRLGFASLEEDDWFRGAGEESLYIA